MFEAIAGPDSRDPTTLPDGVPDMLAALDGDLAGVRLGVDRRFVFENDNTELAAAIEQALAELQALGATIVDTQMLLPDPAELGRLWLTLCAREAYQAHASHFPSHSEDYGPYIRRTLELGAAISEEDFARARIDCMQFRRRFCDLLSTVDAAVCPSGDLTPAIAGLDQRGDFRTLAPIVSAAGFRFTLPANLAGTPTLSLPCGFSRAGIPLSMQLMGSPLSEPLLCRIGHAYQSATDWHTRHPPV